MREERPGAGTGAATAVARPCQAPRPIPATVPPDHLARHYRGECDCGFHTPGQAMQRLLRRTAKQGFHHGVD